MRPFSVVSIVLLIIGAGLAFWGYNRLASRGALAQIQVSQKQNSQQPNQTQSANAPDFIATQIAILTGPLIAERVAANPRLTALVLASSEKETADLISRSLRVVVDSQVASNGVLTLLVQYSEPDSALAIIEAVIEEFQKLCMEKTNSALSEHAESNASVLVSVVTPPKARR
jgi:hypothetical protein